MWTAKSTGREDDSQGKELAAAMRRGGVPLAAHAGGGRVARQPHALARTPEFEGNVRRLLEQADGQATTRTCHRRLPAVGAACVMEPPWPSRTTRQTWSRRGDGSNRHVRFTRAGWCSGRRGHARPGRAVRSWRGAGRAGPNWPRGADGTGRAYRDDRSPGRSGANGGARRSGTSRIRRADGTGRADRSRRSTG